MEDNIDDIHDVPLLDKAQQPLYEGLRTNLLFAIMLLVNLKVLMVCKTLVSHRS